jgi:AcrR family transcriptional regulator
MSPEETNTSERILSAAIELLAGSRPEAITIREIAAKAGVNVAAINYHFRSKDNLIDEAVYAFSSRAFAQGLQLLRDEGVAPAERLLRFLKGYARGLVEYHGITRTAFEKTLASSPTGGRYAGLTREMFTSVAGVLRELTGEADELANARRTLMLFSGVIFPFLFHEPFGEAGGVEAHSPAQRDQYIELLVRTIAATTQED